MARLLSQEDQYIELEEEMSSDFKNLFQEGRLDTVERKCLKQVGDQVVTVLKSRILVSV